MAFYLWWKLARKRTRRNDQTKRNDPVILLLAVSLSVVLLWGEQFVSSVQCAHCIIMIIEYGKVRSWGAFCSVFMCHCRYDRWQLGQKDRRNAEMLNILIMLDNQSYNIYIDIYCNMIYYNWWLPWKLTNLYNELFLQYFHILDAVVQGQGYKSATVTSFLPEFSGVQIWRSARQKDWKMLHVAYLHAVNTK